MKNTLGKLMLAASLAMCMSGNAAAVTYDIVINNGRVMDPETEFDGVRNVGIKDGKIETITKREIAGKETIDATGLVVAPGFIDTHTHSSNKFNIKMSMVDGVTSGMDFEAGALNIAAWYDREAGKWPINYGQCASQEMARKKGLNMWGEYYPYAAGSSAIGADGYKPEAVEGMLGLKYEDMMFDPTQNKYLTKEEQIIIGRAMTTRKHCAEPDGIMEQEQQYLQALARAHAYTLKPDGLELRDENGPLQVRYRVQED